MYEMHIGFCLLRSAQSTYHLLCALFDLFAQFVDNPAQIDNGHMEGGRCRRKLWHFWSAPQMASEEDFLVSHFAPGWHRVRTAIRSELRQSMVIRCCSMYVTEYGDERCTLVECLASLRDVSFT